MKRSHRWGQAPQIFHRVVVQQKVSPFAADGVHAICGVRGGKGYELGWKRVTCKRCLARRPRRRSKEG